MKRKKAMGKFLMYSVLVVAAIVTLYPFLWMIAASFKPLNEIVDGKVYYVNPSKIKTPQIMI